MARPEGSVSKASFSPLLARTPQELISALRMLQGVSEQPFRLKIVAKNPPQIKTEHLLKIYNHNLWWL